LLFLHCRNLMHMENDCKHILRIRLTQYMNLYQSEHTISSKGIIDTALQYIIMNN